MIDQIRKDIEVRLTQLRTEADKLEAALGKLDPRNESQTPRRARPKRVSGSNGAASKAGPATSTPAKPTTGRRRAQAATATGTSARTAPGSTKATVLTALSSDGGMTAGEVAKATGLGRASVSTTLSKLAKSGEVHKAERGYRLAPAAPSSPAE